MLEISAAVSALKSTYEVAKVAVEARDQAKIQAAVAEIGGKLLDVTLAGVTAAEKVADLTAQLQALRGELSELKQKQAQRDRYVLMEFRPGAYAYFFHPIDGEVTPAHYACQACLDQGALSVLQLNNSFWSCPASRDHGVWDLSDDERARRRAAVIAETASRLA